MTNEDKEMINAYFGTVVGLLNDIKEALQGNHTAKPAQGNAAKRGKHRGTIHCVEEKTSAKGTRFMTFFMDEGNPTKLSCNCFDSKLFPNFNEGDLIEADGEHREWKGYLNFTIDSVEVLESNPSKNGNGQAFLEEEDDLPF